MNVMMKKQAEAIFSDALVLAPDVFVCQHSSSDILALRVALPAVR